jgi:hypothetical protein
MEERSYYEEELDYLTSFYKEALDSDVLTAADLHLKNKLRKREYENLIEEF